MPEALGGFEIREVFVRRLITKKRALKPLSETGEMTLARIWKSPPIQTGLQCASRALVFSRKGGDVDCFLHTVASNASVGNNTEISRHHGARKATIFREDVVVYTRSATETANQRSFLGTALIGCCPSNSMRRFFMIVSKF